MKKKTKAIIAAIVIILLVVDIFGANYLVSFAVGRTTSGGESVVPTPSTTDETQAVVDENYIKIIEETQAWFDGIATEKVTIQSDDNLQLAGEICEANTDSHKWAILVHGYSGSHGMMWTFGHMYADNGFNLLLPDMRGHGESEGDYIGMGWPDRKDILNWIEFICERDPNAEIVLFGISMGGATVMMTSGEDLPSNVKAIVEDCGYASVWEIFSDELKALFHLPEFPLLYTANTICKLRAGYSFTKASSVNQVSKSKVPILFIHGAEDNFVHTDMVYKVYDACPTEKDILVVDNAGHGQSYYYSPEEYYDKMFTFLSSYI